MVLVPSETVVLDVAVCFFNWLILTASISSLPSATSWICCPPTLTLFVLNSKPLVPRPTVNPSVLMVVSPNFALFKPVKSFFKVIVTLVPSFATLILSSPEKSTVSPGLTCVAFSLPLVDKFQPLLATDSTPFNWLTFTASSSAVPAVTLWICPALSTFTLPFKYTPLFINTTFVFPYAIPA